MIGRPNVSAEEIGTLIEKDQVLSAKVLRLANSPFYGFPSRIASVAHAVVVLGLNVVKGLTLCATAFDMMRNAGMNELWRHSLGVAMTAHILGTKAAMKNPEEVFVAGLLHDIGKVVLYVKWPDVGQQITTVTRNTSRPLMDTEQELFEVTHADVGGCPGKPGIWWAWMRRASPTALPRRRKSSRPSTTTYERVSIESAHFVAAQRSA